MKLRTIIIGGAILSVVVGFTLGRTVMAGSPEPGSSADPVVSKSYVDQALQDRVQELEKTVAELTVQAQALQTTINDLQAKVNKTGSTKTTTPSGSTTTKPPSSTSGDTTKPETGTSTPPAGSAKGKTAYIQSGNNYVNLRSSATTESSVVKKVNKGEAMQILEEKDKWYYVKLTDGTLGWVASWVVEVK